MQTYVVEYSDSLVRDAIVRELARGGQVFYLITGWKVSKLRLGGYNITATSQSGCSSWTNVGNQTGTCSVVLLKR